MSRSAAEMNLRRTPLYDLHASLGAKLVPFAGYEMPVQYPTGITAEHAAVRERCGLFDVSHMGEFEIRGPDAVAFMDRVTTNHVAALADWQAHYSTVLNEQGTIIDDGLVYRFPDRVMIVVNASNREKVFEHLLKHKAGFDCSLSDISDDIALLALQGPRASSVLQPLTDTDLSSLKYYHFAMGRVEDVETVISRTDYTGEDGFELYFDAGHAPAMWAALTRGGDVTPCGLGARDTLRLEMGMALYGNDIDDTTTPLEANLGWLVKMKKGDFIGRAALERQKAEGIPRKLAGFTCLERAFPRHGYPVYFQGEQAGLVRSGTMSPTLGIPIGTCYLPREGAVEGTSLEIEIRGKRVPAKVVKMPFYTKGSHL